MPKSQDSSKKSTASPPETRKLNPKNQTPKTQNQKLQSINPANGQLFATYEPLSQQKLKSKIEGSESVWVDWSQQSLSKRLHLLENLSDRLLSNKESLSEIITKEMGKPLNQSILEIEKCALLCRYYREHAEHFLSPRNESLHYKKSYIHFAPLGGVLGIMPWNFPFWQVFRFAIPALCTGNMVFLKHSENVTGCALALEDIFLSSNWPAGAFNTLLIQRDQVESVIAHPFIKTVSFTGSTQTGRHIASLCGKHITKSILELGGSDPYIVLEDAYIEEAAQIIVKSRLNNSGQSCIAAKRVIVELSIYEEFISEVIKQLRYRTISNPLYNPDVGPLAKSEFVTHLESVVKKDVQSGAQILYEKHPDATEEKGFYFPITCLGNCSASMEVAQGETFGPLLPLFAVDNEEKALQLANQSPYGLGAAVFTKNTEKGETWARERIQSGSCYVNGMVRSHPALPFGGIGESGYGRELSLEGMREFTNIKTVVVCK